MGVLSIGVVGSTDVAEVFRTIGFDVVSGTDFRDTATLISARLETAPDMPVVVCDQMEPGLGPWTRKVSGQTTVAVLGTTPGTQILEDFPGRVELPATVNDLLPLIGFQPTNKPVGSHTINPTGNVTDDEPDRAAEPPALRALPVDEPASDLADIDTAGVDSSSGNGDVVHHRLAAPTVPAVRPQPAQPDADFDDLFDVRNDGDRSPQRKDTAAHNGDSPHRQDTAEPFQPPSILPAAPLAPTSNLQDSAVEGIDVFDNVSQSNEHASTDTSVMESPATGPAVLPSRKQRHAVVSPTVEENYAPDEDDDFFSRRRTVSPDQSTGQPARFGRTSAHRHGEVVLSEAGKGGVGKSTNALLLAWTAAAAGQTVVLIDANRGQADLRKFLRLPKHANLPTVYDAVGADPSEAILKPEEFAEFRRKAGLEVPDFALVLGPPSDVAGEATAQVYGTVIDHARSIADLVIVDTQIVEAQGVLTDLWADLFIPLLREGAWQIGIADESRAGVDNLIDRLTEFQGVGVSNAHTLIVASKYEQFDVEDAAYFRKSFSRFGTFVGATEFDAGFADQMNMGRLLTDSPSVEPTTMQTLLHITGRQDLYAPREETPVRLPKFLRALFGGNR